MTTEIEFERKAIARILQAFPGAVVLKNDSSRIQGIPDRMVLNGRYWAALEFKISEFARTRPNQRYWVARLGTMGYSSFVNPNNFEKVLDELQSALRSS